MIVTRPKPPGADRDDRSDAAGYEPGHYTTGFGGTSSACPVVAGVAGLILSVNPHLTARQVREILQTTADKITDPNPDPQLGLSYGSYNGQGHSQWFGYGKVNAFAAVQAAQVI
jgi:subtilisin family serine protease